MDNFIIDFDGFDDHPNGKMDVLRFPWLPAPAVNNSATIVEDAGAFPMSKGMSFVTGNAQVASNSIILNSIGTVSRNLTGKDNKVLFGVGFWFRVDEFKNNFANYKIGGIATTREITLLSISNVAADGRARLHYTTNFNTYTSNQVTVDLQPKTNYWIYCKYASNGGNTPVKASFYINNIPLAEDMDITISADASVNTLWDRYQFYSSASNFTYTVDDFAVQSVSGNMDTWPAGFENDLPKPCTIDMLPNMTSRRVKGLPIIANGSVNEFTPSNTALENWQNAISDTDYVQATENGQVDLYKVDKNAVALRDVTAVKFQATTNTYFSLEPAYKSDTSSVTTLASVNKGGDVVSYVLNQTALNEDWTPDNIGDSEFGLKSL